MCLLDGVRVSVCVCVCVQIIRRSEASSCAYSWFLCKKKTDDSGRSRSVNVSVED